MSVADPAPTPKRRQWTWLSPETEFTELQARYAMISSFPLFIAGLVWLIAFILRYSPSLAPIYGHQAENLMRYAWLVFFTDVVITFIIDPHKKGFARRHLLVLVALVIPPMRIALLVVAVHRLHMVRSGLARRVGIYAFYTAVSVISLGALITLLYEVDAPGANIRSYGDSFWWAIATVFTVGYGDFVPVTVGGRVSGAVVMFAGTGVVGAMTAAIASRWIGRGSDSPAPTIVPTASAETSAPAATTADPSIEVVPDPPGVVTGVTDDVSDTIASLKAQISRLESLIGKVDAPPGPASPVTSGTADS